MRLINKIGLATVLLSCSIASDGVFANEISDEITFEVPDGQIKYYCANVSGFNKSNVQIVYGDEDVVYVKGLIASTDYKYEYNSNVWVKGHKDDSGAHIIIPSGSVLAVQGNEFGVATGVGSRLYSATYATGKLEIDNNVQEIVFDMHPSGNLYLSTERHPDGLIATCEYEEKNNIHWPDLELIYVFMNIVKPSDSYESLEYQMRYYSIDCTINKDRISTRDVSITFVDGNVYIKGLMPDCPELWIKGTFQNHYICFNSSMPCGIGPHGGTVYIKSGNIENNCSDGNTCIGFSLSCDHTEDVIRFRYDNTAGDICEPSGDMICDDLDFGGYSWWGISWSRYDYDGNLVPEESYKRNYPMNWFYSPEFLNKSGKVYNPSGLNDVKDGDYDILSVGAHDVYDLFGCRVPVTDNLTPGLYIVEGRKVFIR